MEFQKLDPIAWVKRDPARFFPGGEVDELVLVSNLMFDAVVLGRGECRIVRRDRWHFVSSDVDWLAHELTVEELFHRVVPAPRHGRNAMRGEVLVYAYASDVLAFSNGVAIEIKGERPHDSLLKLALADGWTKALVAFRLGS